MTRTEWNLPVDHLCGVTFMSATRPPAAADEAATTSKRRGPVWVDLGKLKLIRPRDTSREPVKMEPRAGDAFAFQRSVSGRPYPQWQGQAGDMRSGVQGSRAGEESVMSSEVQCPPGGRSQGRANWPGYARRLYFRDDERSCRGPQQQHRLVRWIPVPNKAQIRGLEQFQSTC